MEKGESLDGTEDRSEQFPGLWQPGGAILNWSFFFFFFSFFLLSLLNLFQHLVGGNVMEAPSFLFSLGRGVLSLPNSTCLRLRYLVDPPRRRPPIGERHSEASPDRPPILRWGFRGPPAQEERGQQRWPISGGTWILAAGQGPLGWARDGAGSSGLTLETLSRCSLLGLHHNVVP